MHKLRWKEGERERGLFVGQIAASFSPGLPLQTLFLLVFLKESFLKNILKSNILANIKRQGHKSHPMMLNQNISKVLGCEMEIRIPWWKIYKQRLSLRMASALLDSQHIQRIAFSGARWVGHDLPTGYFLGALNNRKVKFTESLLTWHAPLIFVLHWFVTLKFLFIYNPLVSSSLLSENSAIFNTLHLFTVCRTWFCLLIKTWAWNQTGSGFLWALRSPTFSLFI